MDKIAILLPCFNEAITIEKVIRDFQRELPEAVIYVYDNNSTDDTSLIARRAGAVVRTERNQGKGNVVRRMFREVDAFCYIMADGDDTYPAECAPAMARLVLEESADMVVGDRLSSTYFTENKRPFHNFGNVLVLKSINLLFNANISDIMTGYRAFSYSFVKTFPVIAKGFEIETEMSIHAVDKNMRLENVPVGYRDRPKGSKSKLNTVADGCKVLRAILSLFKNYRPLAFFSIIALVLILIAILMFIPIMIEYFKTGEVRRFPTLFACGFIALAGIQSYFGGLILDVIRIKNRQDFEINLLNIHERIVANEK